MKKVCIAAACVVVLSACFADGRGGDAGGTPTHTFGSLRTEGVLTSTGVSLLRRGTHVLHRDGAAFAYLESPRVSLHDFVGKEVLVEGELEPNTRPVFLPVLVVSGVTLLDGADTRTEHALPSLSLTLSLPSAWQSTVSQGALTAVRPGEDEAILTVSPVLLEAEPRGIPVRVGGRSAVRVDAPNGMQRDVYVRGSPWILFSFRVPADDLNPEESFAAFSSILASVRFVEDSDSSPSSPVSGSGAGALCGGPAGLLCSSGFYCRITDAQENTGTCVPFARE